MSLLYSQILGTGKPLLILHGFLGMSDNWRTMGKLWAAHFEVHLIDLRNHGRSFHSNAFSYTHMAEDLTAYCQHHQLASVVLLGHSMGGKLAMHFATTHAAKVERLIIADMPLGDAADTKGHRRVKCNVIMPQAAVPPCYRLWRKLNFFSGHACAAGETLAVGATRCR